MTCGWATSEETLTAESTQFLILPERSFGSSPLTRWIMMNSRRWMNAKVRLMIGLAPVTAAALHPASPLNPLATFSQGLCGMLSFTGNYEFLAKDSLITDLKQNLLG